MKYFACVLIVLLALVVSAPVYALTAGITLDVHQDVQVPPELLPNDFHVEGKICSHFGPPVLTSHTDGPFAPPAGTFSYTITKISADPEDCWYTFTGDWSFPVGSPGIPYCTISHFGLVFDVNGSNVIINLVGWWTRDGVKIGEVIPGNNFVNRGYVPVGGFNVTDDATGSGQMIRITNGTQPDPPFPPIGIEPPLIPISITQMGVVPFPAGTEIPIDALKEGGAQQFWPWVTVVDANNTPISTTNPMPLMPDSFFDVFLEISVPGKPGLPAGAQFAIPPGGFLVARTKMQFTNNSGQIEERWQWDIHGQPTDTCQWNPGNPAKWVQMPDVSPTGIDIRDDVNDGIGRVLADDFKCTQTGPITDIHFWGSWLNDLKGEIESITTSFYSDIPDPDGTGPAFSKPGTLKWQHTFVQGQFSEKLYATLAQNQYEWFWDPATGGMPNPLGDRNVWQYDICIDPLIAFTQLGTETNPVIYWLAIQVRVKQGTGAPAKFGWKTRDPISTNYGGGHYNDDAAWSANGLLWNELRYPAPHPLKPQSLDMAFVITGTATQPTYDFGDAPDKPYPTLLASNGARHIKVDKFYLGQLIDTEPDGQPNATATGDDTNNLADEDGVVFMTPLQAGQNAQIVVTAAIPGAMTGMLDAWVDFNGNGSWADPGEQIFASTLLINGNNTLVFPVPNTGFVGGTFARFRLTDTGGQTFTGLAQNGEVEDYQVHIAPAQELFDFGDAPDVPYPTLLASNGARHIVKPNMMLGTAIDVELNGQPNLTATGDDIAGVPDDEDGVTFKNIYIGCWAMVRVVATMPGMINAWIDFNGNGSWADPGDQIFTNKPVNPGINWLTYYVPPSAAAAKTFARFRYNSVGGLTFTGLATDGEVEDYQVSVRKKPIVINKAQAKLLPIGTEVMLERNVVTANFRVNGWYFEEPDREIGPAVKLGRWAGIGVVVDPEYPATWVPGDLVSCVGTTVLNGCELMVREEASWKESIETPLLPLAQNNRNSGGAVFGNQPGMVDEVGGAAVPKLATGLNSIGLLVRISGYCRYVETDVSGGGINAWLDDGSGLWDGTFAPLGKRALGIKVHFETLPTIPISAGQYYFATGIMRTVTASTGDCARCLWATDISR